MSAAAKPMCCVRIGYEDYLMPMDAGLKVVALLAGAVKCERDYARMDRDRYVVAGPAETGLHMVQPHQVVMPDGTPHAPAAKPRKAARGS